MMIPRAAVCAERIVRGARHRVRRSCRRPTPVTDARRPRRARAARRRVPLPGRRASRCCATSRFTAPARADHRDHRQHRRRQDHAAQPGPAAVRRHRRRGAASTASTSATSTRTLLWSRIGLVPQKPYLFSGTVASNLRYGNPDATDEELWEALEIAQAARLRRGDARGARRADRAGRHQRLRRPAAAARDRPGAGPHARRSTCSTTRSPRSTSPPTPGCARRCARSPRDATVRDRRPAGLHHPRRRPDPRARGRRGRRPRHATTSCSRRCPTYAEIVASQLTAEEAA